MDSDKPEVTGRGDHESGFGSRIGKLTAATLDAATDFFKAGETGVKQIFSAQRPVKRKDSSPPRLVKRTLDEVRSPAGEARGIGVALISELEKKFEIEKIINLKKQADLERALELERQGNAERFSELESRIAAKIAVEIEKRVAEAIAAGVKADSDITERVVLQRIGELETRLERERRGVIEKIAAVEDRLAAARVESPAPDAALAVIAGLESRIDVEIISTAQKISELEGRLQRESSNILEKLVNLGSSISTTEAPSNPVDHLQERIAEIEKRIETECTVSVEKISDLENRIEYENSVIAGKLTILEGSIAQNGSKNHSVESAGLRVDDLEARIEAEHAEAAVKMRELESRIEHESKITCEKLTALESILAENETGNSSADSTRLRLDDLETRIEAENILSGQKISELERRLDRDSRSILEKLIRLDDRVTSGIAAVAVADVPDASRHEKIAELENRLEQERRNNLEKRLDLVGRIDDEKHCRSEIISGLESRLRILDGRLHALENRGPHSFQFVAEAAAAEKSRDISITGQHDRPVVTAQKPAFAAVGAIAGESSPPAQGAVHNNESSEISEIKVERSVAVLGKQNLLAGLAAANNTITEKNPAFVPKKTSGRTLT